MKSKTINKILCAKFDDWIASIEDEALRDRVKKNTIITGGAIASMLLNEEVNDYDVYFKDIYTAESVAMYYVDKFKLSHNNADIKVATEEGRVRIVTKKGHRGATEGDSAVLDDSGEIEDKYDELNDAALEVQDPGKYRSVFLSTNAITLSNKVQVIIRFYGQPDELHENYDFVHCTNYWTSWDRKVTLQPKALEALLAKELRYVGSKYPLCSIMRLRKFIKRGWSVNAGQILKMAMQLNDMDLTDPKVLEDQLTGVDSAYFSQLVSQLAERDPEVVQVSYLLEILERMF